MHLLPSTILKFVFFVVFRTWNRRCTTLLSIRSSCISCFIAYLWWKVAHKSRTLFCCNKVQCCTWNIFTLTIKFVDCWMNEKQTILLKTITSTHLYGIHPTISCVCFASRIHFKVNKCLNYCTFVSHETFNVLTVRCLGNFSS